ncbi:methyl-accepting chemotaxis protein [Cellulosilyticum sp. I15G10I2]|uniref:methyl-accepting chemotaxis protein n=1 Tax=Cellulosilyticum sp. I15G10I2 TaxID=1892843 RepID=UPI00085BC1D7|nr:methyl-accepting chemotaxis protein [Cellulosilyticum sp. I15G10I2]
MKGKREKKQLRGIKRSQVKGVLSIRYKLILGFVAFAIIPLVTVSMVSYTMSRSTLRETCLNFTAELINQAGMSLEYYLKSIEKKAVSLCIDPIIGEGLKGYESEDILTRISATRDMERKLLALSTVEDEIEEIRIIHSSGAVIGGNTKASGNLDEIYKMASAEPKGIWKKNLGDDIGSIYYLRNIRDLNTGKDIGTLQIKIKEESLTGNIKDIDILEGANLYIADENGQMIHNSDENQEQVEDNIWNILSDDEGEHIMNAALINYKTLSNGWKVITEIPESSLTSKLDMTNMIVFILIAVATFVAIGFGILISQSFSKPIIKMMQLMKAAELGDITVKMEENRKDEIGMLCISFNHMISNIRKLLEETRSVIAHTVEDSSLLKDATQHSVEAFKQLSLSIGDIAVGATNQAENAEEGTSAMYTLSGSIQEVMQNTNEIVSKNQDAKEIIKETNDSIQQLNITMSSSIQVSSQIESSIIELSTLTKNIEEVMKLLDGISEQTNLLALNASIEAARAGEVGKGFAVVANEVRNLAEQSKLSTRNVRKTLNTIQDKTKEAVDLVKNSKHIVIKQEQAVKNTDQAFYSIIELLKNMDVALQSVSVKVSDMEQIKEETITKIEKIGAVTSDTVAATQEVNALSEEQRAVIEQLFEVSNKFTAAMDQLNGSMNRFKIE